MANNIKINNPLGVQPQQKRGSGFVNLNKILQANIGNRFGQTVAQGISQGVGRVQQGIGQLKSEFQQEADKQNLASVANKQAVSDALKSISSGQTKVSDELIKQFGTFRAGEYEGPRELDSSKLTQIGSKAAEVQRFGRDLGSGGDKTRVLQAFAGQGPYSVGQSRLDALLLGQGPQARQQLAQARQQTLGLTQQLGKEQDIARQIGRLRVGEAQKFAKDVKGQLTSAETDIGTKVGEQQKEFIKGQKNLFNQLYEAGADLSPEQLSFIGKPEKVAFTPSGGKYKRFDIGTTVPLGDISSGVVTTPEQRAMLTALNQLQGRNYLAPTEQYVASPEQSIQSGIYGSQGQIPFQELINLIKQTRQTERTQPIKTPPRPGARFL